MHLLLNFLLRVVLLAAGLSFALLMACFFVLVVAAWSVRAAWLMLTGRTVTPFVMGAGGAGRMYQDMMRRAGGAREASSTPRADAAAGGRTRMDGVTDVEPK